MRLDGSRLHFTRNSSNKNENEWNTENPIEIYYVECGWNAL